MFDKSQYELIDFGQGRRLDRFGSYVLDRPCQVAKGLPRGNDAAWTDADAVYTGANSGEGNWRSSAGLPLSWTIAHNGSTFELKLTDFGHVGLFPEHAVNWDWITHQVRSAGQTLKVLNLFAYTGGATIAAVAGGAEVVHVDAAQNAVLWARRNTQASDMANAPIRWITEDVRKFVQREIRRGNKYHGVVLDPPSYGHGPKGEVWKLDEHLPSLLEMCAELTVADRRFVLLSCHTTGIEPADLERMLRDSMGGLRNGVMESGGLALQTIDGRQMPAGIATRWAVNR
ncbi:MAG: SAM-dependent methyltransferase [Planctomycetota bacterium]|nr:MAG: SAM-dependent methyltransferase [Planctomycetota bacterium]REJ88313.1 MAG: SAM-dependent methyltransferase [Planctomycetota bacterium]REK44764.1 MAG: SAM-dependent methyltransferase [Planctomycetota bacterium]